MNLELLKLSTPISGDILAVDVRQVRAETRVFPRGVPLRLCQRHRLQDGRRRHLHHRQRRLHKDAQEPLGFSLVQGPPPPALPCQRRPQRVRPQQRAPH